MWPFNKKNENVKIINTGNNLPDATIEQEMRFLSERERFIKNIVENQARNTGNIIYGAQAVNAIVGTNFSRPTTDFDIMSKTPKKHAIEIEKKIDNHVGADIAHVKQVNYERDGNKGKMYRVALKNWDNIADYNILNKKIKTIKINGVNYEHLDLAEKKYIKMIRENDTKRIINANQDLNRINMFNYWKKIF